MDLIKLKEWDAYFHSMCCTVAQNSKCLSRQIGAILVRDNVVICTGYNGPPRGYPHCDWVDAETGKKTCPRRILGYKSGEGLHICPAAHAERNAIVQAARLGIPVKGSTLYLNTGVPCKDCLIEIINAGVQEVVCENFAYYDDLSQSLIKYSDLKLRLFTHLAGEVADA